MPIATPQGTLDFKSVDTVTFVGASSNTVIDTTTGSLGVGVDGNGPTSNLHVVGHTRLEGDINMLHTANTASIKLNSNVVTEFNRSKKLIKYPRVAMSQNDETGTSGYVASASTTNPSRDPYRAFDNVLYSSWHEPVYQSNPYPNTDGAYTGGSGTVYDTNGYQGEYLQIQLPEKIKLYNYSISNRAAAGIEGRQPKDAKIFASNDGNTWIDIHTHSDGGGTYDIAGETRSFQLDNITETHYKYYRLVINSIIQGGSSDTANISQWKLFGVPEYDPEADGVDVVVKSVPNVPNTDWLEVYYDAKNYTSGLVQDLSTNSFNGTLTNGASFNNSDGIDKFVFDGSNDYISGSIPSTFTGNQTYTFSIWVKPDSHPSSGFVGVFEVGTRSSNDSMGLYFDTGKIIHLAYGDNLATTTVATIGHWVHITGTYTSGDRRVYANGNLLKQDDYSGLTLVGTTFKLGSNEAGTQAFNGSIANFRLFNRALTPDEIYQLYAYQKEDFGHGDLGMTLKAGRLGIGTSEPRAMLDVRGGIYANGGQSWPIPCAIFSNVTPSNTGSTYYENNIGTIEVNYNNISLEDPSGTIQASVGSPNITLNRVGMYEFHTESSLKLQSGAGSSHIGHAIIGAGVSGSGSLFESGGYELVTTTYNTVKLVNRTSKVLVTNAPYVVKYQLQPIANFTDRFIELAYGSNNEIHSVAVKYLG
jgi:hypothetical protein